MKKVLYPLFIILLLPVLVKSQTSDDYKFRWVEDEFTGEYVLDSPTFKFGSEAGRLNIISYDKYGEVTIINDKEDFFLKYSFTAKKGEYDFNELTFEEYLQGKKVTAPSLIDEERYQIILAEVSTNVMNENYVNGTITFKIDEELRNKLTKKANIDFKIRVDGHVFRFYGDPVFLIQLFDSFVEDNPYPTT